jgi:glutathione S-transferase
MKRKAPSVMAACFELIEAEFVTGPWVMGERYSVVDPYLFTLTSWLPFHKIDVARFPKVSAHQQQMLQRPAVTAALAAESSA